MNHVLGQYEEFSTRTMWSLSNAFASAFKKLYPVPQFKATAKLGEFLTQLPLAAGGFPDLWPGGGKPVVLVGSLAASPG
jgi:hypothetical protein